MGHSANVVCRGLLLLLERAGEIALPPVRLLHGLDRLKSAPLAKR